MTRSKASQTKHDQLVRSEAKKLERQGFKVQADVRDYSQPKTIGGYRPDVIGTKGHERKIVEVETPDTLGSARDQAQQRAFRDAANCSTKTTFIQKVAQ